MCGGDDKAQTIIGRKVAVIGLFRNDTDYLLAFHKSVPGIKTDRESHRGLYKTPDLNTLLCLPRKKGVAMEGGKVRCYMSHLCERCRHRITIG